MDRLTLVGYDVTPGPPLHYPPASRPPRRPRRTASKQTHVSELAPIPSSASVPASVPAPALAPDITSTSTLPLPSTSSSLPDAAGGSQQEPEEDSFRVEYHPHSGKQPEMYKFHEFDRHHDAKDSFTPPPMDEQPWRPAFRSRLEFEFAEVALEAALNRTHINKLISIMKDVRTGKGDFSFDSYEDLDKRWQNAYKKLTPVGI